MSGELVLVSGASGYVGAWVVKKLQEAGYRVRGTVRSLKNEKKVKFLYDLCPGAQHPVELVEADLLDAESWKGAVKDCKYIMHTASPYPSRSPKTEDEVVKPALAGTLNVLRAVVDTGAAKRVVLTSSFAAIQGREQRDGPYSEEDWSVASNQNGAYMKSKTLAEKAAWDFVKELPHGKKFELCVLNPVVIEGPALHGNPGTSVDTLVQMMEGKMPMVPKFYIPMVDVRDVAEAHLRCLTNDDTVGKRHLLFGEVVRMPEIATWLQDEFSHQGYKIRNGTVPNAVLTVVGWFSSEVRGAKEFAGKPMELKNDRFKHVLGIDPVPMRKSVIDMAYSLIELGIVHKADKYIGRPAS